MGQKGISRILLAWALFQLSGNPAYCGAVDGRFCTAYQDNHSNFLEVSPEDNLAAAVRGAASGTTILLQAGVYRVPTTIVFRIPDVTLRSKSGNYRDVVLDGNLGGLPLDRSKFIPEIIAVSTSGITLADITIRYARNHGIHAYPTATATENVENLLIHNVNIYDCGQQLIKANSNGRRPARWVDRTVLECSILEFIDNSVMENKGTYFYTGGLDVHGGSDWVIRWNLFRNIQREGKMMEHAVHMWDKSRGTMVENNRFENVYRAIGFGMMRVPSLNERKYGATGSSSRPYFDHIGGVIRNNTVFNDAMVHLESGIELLNVLGAEVHHNTVVSLTPPFSSIEYRWPDTLVTIKNNLCSHRIVQRNGASAVRAGNLESVPLTTFVNAFRGDLHLSPAAFNAIGQGVILGPLRSGIDMDGEPRGASPDIGADEYSPGRICR